MLRLLLVVAVLSCAQTQGTVTSQQPRLLQALGDASRALHAAQRSLQDALPTPTSTPAPAPATSTSLTLTSVSVVQDWSLVCQELCGAGLGVTPCANSCAKSSRKTAKILNKVFDLAKCEQLHGLQTVETVKSYGARLCSSYCHQRRRTLSGCSPCRYSSVADAVSSVQSDPSHGSMASEAHQELAVATTEAAAQTADASSSDSSDSSETPDWDEVCKALCKTGDGGSLCNCDLSPFFS
ncbi:hypothetical protein KR222_008768 [Zaprionus bogoriensis]|nr:hypothetical protein KR222_008768 [Zaprionus bogoriensis]